jgi:two-component system sensor kinase FixL
VEGDGPGRFVGFIQDITARRRAEAETRGLQEQLAHVSRLAIVGEMSAGIAHELNQPLTAASNYAQACDRLLGRENPDIAEVRDALRQITAQAERSAGIIRKLRGLASNDSKVLAMSDINLIIEELTDLVLGDAKKNKIHYVLDLERSIPQLEVDSAQIQQVIFSLVRNAMEALIESAVASRQIIVRTRLLAGHDVEIAVLDNGPGVSAEVLPRLFDPFCSSKPHGTGLGLATSRTIAKSHHGSLTYISNDPSGACFILRLPIPDRSEK